MRASSFLLFVVVFWAKLKAHRRLIKQKRTERFNKNGIPRPRTKEEIGSRARGGGESKTSEYALVRAHVWDGFVLRESERVEEV